MTTTPKIDTTAPERVWANVTAWGDGKPLCGEWNHCDVKSPDDTEYERRDLADARAAAAAQAMREAAAQELEHHLSTIEDVALCRVWQERIRALPIPPDTQAALDRLIAERVREATADLRGLLWLAGHEFMAIRARSGAPLDYQGMTTVSEEWWDQLTRAIFDAVGPDARKPWPSDEAKAVTARILTAIIEDVIG